MRILYLAHRIPYPPNKGDKIRSYHHLRHLAREHEVHLCTFIDDPRDEPGMAALRELCASVVSIRLEPKSALLRGALALASGRSLSEGYFGSRAMHAAVASAAGPHGFDVAWAFSSVMTQYLSAARASSRIADFVDVDSDKWQQYADHSGRPRRWGFHLEARRVRALERHSVPGLDCVLFVSTAEAELFRTMCPAAPVRVVPNGVDTTYFRPEPENETTPPTLLFTGALDYWPNVEAVLFAIHEVLPLVRRDIPDARLLAVGHRPAAALLHAAEAQRDRLTVAGSVPDIRPYFSQARAYLAPLQLGRGVQNKILEAMAMRLPVIASPRALAGLAIEAGRHALVCHTPQEFAAAVTTLLRDPPCGRALATQAARLIHDRYGWPQNLQLLDACLADCARAPAMPRPHWEPAVSLRGVHP